MSDQDEDGKITIEQNSNHYFNELIDEAKAAQKININMLTQNYLSDLLRYYLVSDHLFVASESGKRAQPTLAEQYLKAQNSQPRERIELLKKTGDQALYVSGFFGQSLNRKIVDVDYYVNMGSSAYTQLSHCIREATFTELYLEISQRFIILVDLLSFISRKTMTKDGDAHILELFSRYSKTNSEDARQQLVEAGIFDHPASNRTSRAQ